MKKKGLLSGLVKYLLIVWCLLFCSQSLFAQKQSTQANKITSDTNKVKKEGFLGFIKSLFHRNKNPSNDYIRKNDKSKKDTVAAKRPRKAEPFELTKGNVTWSSLYTQGVNLNTGVSGLYTLGRLSQGFDVYGGPFSAQGTGVFNNGQYERSYSSYSVNFDVEGYMNGLRKRAENILMDRKNGGKRPDLSDSLNAYESLREKVQSPSYQTEENANKSQFQRDEDSLKVHPGSDTTELHSLRNKLYSYDQNEKRYQQLFTIKKNSGSLQKADSSDKKYTQDEKLLNNSDNIQKMLEANHQLNGYEKFLMGVQKFSIGQSPEEISEFTLHNFMLNGVNLGYKTDGTYTYAGYGKEVAVINPFLMTGINVPNYHRTMEFVRIGEGSENGSNFYATIIGIADPGGGTSLDEKNWIFDITKQVAIGKDVEIEGELAKSEFSYSHRELDSAALLFTPTNNNTQAYALRGKATLPGLKTRLKAEVSNTGGDFITLGNPYLISGATKYELDLTQPLGREFTIAAGATHVLENTASAAESKQTDNWIHFSLLYKPTNLINMEFKYSPRQFQEQSGTVYANSTTSNINEISFLGDISSNIFGENMTTTIFAGNFQYNATESSQLFAQNLNLSYYMLNELFVITPTQGIKLSIDESRNNWTGSLAQFIGESIYNWNLKKSLGIGLGPQWVEQPGLIPNEAGVTGSLNSSIQKWGKVGLQFTYRNNIQKPLSNSSQYLANVNISVLW